MIDLAEIAMLRLKNPANVKEVKDILYYSNYYNKHHMNKSYPEPGVYEYLNEPEKKKSKKDWPYFTYNINECGFRDTLPDKNDDNVIGFFGCSITFGEGLDSATNFPTLLANDLKMSCLNLGQPGLSPENVSVIFEAASNIWDMKIAVVTIPVWSRFLYMEEKGYVSGIVAAHPQYPGETEDVRRAVMENFSDLHLMYAFVRSVNHIVSIAKNKNIKLVFGTWHYEAQQLLYDVMGIPAPNLDNDYKVDTARDNAHPHPKSCQQYYLRLKEFIEQENFI